MVLAMYENNKLQSTLFCVVRKTKEPNKERKILHLFPDIYIIYLLEC